MRRALLLILFLAVVGLAMLFIESIKVAPATVAAPPADGDVLDLRIGRVPAPRAVVLLPPAPTSTPAPTAPPRTTIVPAPGPPAGADDPGRYYVVQPGDTLGTIAQAQLGSATLAGALARLNELRDADSIVVGQVLRLR